MADRTNITPELCRQLLRYEPETGRLFWKPRPADLFQARGSYSREHGAKVWNARWAGKEAFTATNYGYKVGAIQFCNMAAHRVIWAIVHGQWPQDQIDHINGDRSDNRLENLRAVSDAENKKNMRRRADNRSGRTGVYWSAQAQKWTAEIKINGRKIGLGQFHNLNDAIRAREAGESRFGFHTNHGRSP